MTLVPLPGCDRKRTGIGYGQDDRRRIVRIPIIRNTAILLQDRSLDVVSFNGQDFILSQPAQQLGRRLALYFVPCQFSQDTAIGLTIIMII